MNALSPPPSEKQVLSGFDDLRTHAVSIGVLKSSDPTVQSWSGRFYDAQDDLKDYALGFRIINFEVYICVELDPSVHVSVGDERLMIDMYKAREVVVKVTPENFAQMERWANYFGLRDELFVVDADQYSAPDYEVSKRRIRKEKE